MTPEEQLNNEVFDLLVIGTYAKDLSRNERRAFLRKIRGVFEFALKSEVK